MEKQSVIERFTAAVNELAESMGLGNMGAELLLIVLGLATIIIGLGLLSTLFKSKKQGDTAHVNRVDGIAGKLERTERTLNELRTDALRQLDINRREVDFLRQEVQELRTFISNQFPGGFTAPDMDSSVVEPSERERRPSREESTGFKPAEFIEHLEAEEPAPSIEPDEAAREPEPESLSTRLKKTRVGFFEKIRSVFGGKPKLDEDAVADLEAILVSSDLGIKTSLAVLAELKEDVKNGAEVNEGGLAAILKQKLLAIIEKNAPKAPITAPRRNEDGPMIVLVVGVNGVGKTTTVAKLAHQWKDEGSRVLMVAADTFRAAAVEQLHEWGRRLDIPVVSGPADSKPQTVVFDGMVRAKEEPVDVVIIDTAGRLHTKQNLMDELEGIRNAIQRHFPNAPDEVILVLDGSTGQNAIVQAREFNAATALTGLVVTKLDGTSKGGVVVAIKEELGVPIRYIGVGEGQRDLRPFVARDFVEALFGFRAEEQNGAPSANAEIRRQRRASGG